MKSNSLVAADLSKAAVYSRVYGQLSELMRGESTFLANAANTASLLYHSLPDVNWAGFYFLHSEHLVLGPFQGKPACTRIQVGAGVCGTAAASRATVVVPDVRQFSGHIMCDAESKSEIAVPLLNWGRLIGVLDIDSPVLNRFDEDDQDGIESLAALFLSSFASNDLPDFEALAVNAIA